MRSEAEGKPDHPNWREIHAEERRRRQPLNASRVMIWTDDTGRWRYSQSYLTSNTDEPSYVDAVVAGSVMWQLTPEELHVASTSEGTAPGVHGDPRSRERTMRVYLRELLHGRLAEGAAAGMAPDGVVELLGDRRWAAYASQDDRMRLRYEGVWDPEFSRGFVESVIVAETAPEVADFRGTRYEFDGWHVDPLLQKWLAETATEISPDGVVTHRTVLDRVVEASPVEFDALVSVPPVDGDDPVRGPVTYRSLYDHRPSALARQDLGPDRNVLATADLPGARSWRRWRVGGWILAGVLVGGFVWLRVRSSRAGTVG